MITGATGEEIVQALDRIIEGDPEMVVKNERHLERVGINGDAGQQEQGSRDYRPFAKDICT